MKKLLGVLIFTGIWASSSANHTAPKTTLPVATKKEVVKTPAKVNKNDFIVSTTKSNVKEGQFRIQRRFLFEDACGNMWIIYVSGPSTATYSQMYGVAQHDFVAGADSNGCFHGL